MTTVMKYNPAFLDDATLIRSFVARHVEFDRIVEITRENTGAANQHILVIGPRGSGKTTLVLRVAAEIRSDDDLRVHWYPVTYGEESYQVTSPGEFWLEALFHLGEQTEQSRWKNAYEALREERDEDRLRQRALAQLMDFADEREKRLLLIVENLNTLIGAQMSGDDAWTLRHTLMNEPRIMLLGTATSRFKEVEDYNQALYDLFKTIDLEPLENDEARAVWHTVAGTTPKPEQIRPIQILTGGNPRLIRILSEFAADTSFQELMTNLTQLVDEHTEYFKHHLDSLPPKERKVFVTLADIWDPATARDVADAARIDINSASSLLNRLVDRGAATVVRRQGRTKYYQVAERMYNIYHLMRRRGRASSRIRAVVRFMIHLYKGDDLVRTTAALIEEACALPPDGRRHHYMAYEAILTMTPELELKTRIVAETSPLFSTLPDIPASVRQYIDTIQTEEQREKEDLDEREQEALLKLRVEEVEDIDTLVRLGKALSTQPGRLEEAEAAYRKALLKLVRFIESKKHDSDEALDAFDHVLAIIPNAAIGWQAKGYFLGQLERHSEALDAFNRALDINPDDAATWSNKSAALFSIQRYEEALDAADRALELDPENINAWFNKGRTFFRIQRYEDALEVVSHILKSDPENATAWLNKGLTQKELQHYEQALESIDHALELNSDNAAAWHERGVILSQLGRHRDGFDAIEHALELDPDNVNAWRDKGTILVNLKRYDEALNIYNHVLELTPDDGIAWRNKGRILFRLQRYEEALDALNRALDINTNDATTWHLKGLTLANLQRYEEALATHNRASDLNPKNTIILNAIAWTLYLLGDKDQLPEAETVARRAVKLSSETDTYQQHTLAAILGAQGKWAEALERATLFLQDTEMVMASLNDVIDFFVEAAAAGHTAEALERIEASPSTEILEPMMIALRMYQDKEVDVALEIREVASDVVQRIETRRKERKQREN